MEIVVHGKGTSFYMPDQVVLNLDFLVRESEYNKALEKGSSSVLEFVTLLTRHGFSKEDLKTTSFYVKEEREYNESTKQYDINSYSYKQSAILKFVYVKDRLALIIDEISGMENPPSYNIDFTVRDIDSCKKDNLVKAYSDAKMQAELIASAAGFSLKYCAKVSLEPFNTESIPFEYARRMAYNDSGDGYNMKLVSQVIKSAFTPDDVMLTSDLYCLWIAEVR